MLPALINGDHVLTTIPAGRIFFPVSLMPITSQQAIQSNKDRGYFMLFLALIFPVASSTVSTNVS
jgi:hypothetical protein